jgi:eukaryotic-like serine/threonine-protein kinase
MKTCPVCDTPYPNQHNTCPTDGAVLIESRELPPGYIVRGKYRIVCKLGQGGMGVVYLAQHLLLGGDVALKFLAVELSRSPQFVKRFRNEARAAYQLRHPNIVEVTDLDQDGDAGLFIAMEYVAGPNLRSVLREAKGPLPVVRALHIARGVAAGLAAAHARGAVHRDIKPENILLTVEPDGGEHAKVLDFGIAVMTENVTSLSRTHGLLLTPEYAAPEQWRGTPAAELDGRTDLYALGGLLYEMLAGRTPFRAVNPEGWMFQHIQGVPEPLGLLRPDLASDHPGLEALVMRLLARERELRFPSAAALLEALGAKPPAPHPAPDVRPTLTLHPAAVAEPPAAESATEATALWEALAPKPPAPHPAPDVRPAPTPHPAAVVAEPPAAKPATAVAQPSAATEIFSQRSPRVRIPIWAGLIVAGLGIVLAIVLLRSASTKPASVRRTYDRGKDADNHKQYARARTLFAQACDAGELRACNSLGFLYAQGLGGAQDTEKARAVYLKACDLGNALSCAGLGSLYEDAGNNAEARKYFKKACDGGLAESCGRDARLKSEQEARGQASVRGPAQFVDGPPGGQEVFSGTSIHVCPLGFAMGGANVSKNQFTCVKVIPNASRLVSCNTSPGAVTCLNSVLDVGTHANYGRGSMHVCPTGTYMRGLHDGKNWLVCTGGVDLSPSSQNPSIFLDSNGATVGNDMHMCPQSSIMTGIHDERNDFACVHFIR